MSETTCVTLHEGGVYLTNGVPQTQGSVSPEEGRKQTIAYSILSAHNTSGNEEKLKIKFEK